MKLIKCDFCGRDSKGAIYYHIKASDKVEPLPEYHGYDICDSCLKLIKLILKKKEAQAHDNIR